MATGIADYGFTSVIDADAAWQTLSDLNLATLVPKPATQPQPAEAQAIQFIDPILIQTDAKTYQFRSGGDAKGVTNKGRYAGVKKWDALLHGDPILLHERIDGTLFVADGHHRLDLAKRLNAEGTGPGKLAAMVLREADGYTPEDVRVIAAYKNMQHGHTDVVDAARVFKEAESGHVHRALLPQLQMDKGNLQISYSLSKLSDAALSQVASGDVPAEMAARVAEQVTDPARQEKVMGFIKQKLHHEDAPEQPYNMQVSVHYSGFGAAPDAQQLQSFAQRIAQERLQFHTSGVQR